MFHALIQTLNHLTVCYYHVKYKFQSESTLYSFPACQVTPCSKQVPYRKFKWQQQDLNPQPLSLYTNTQPFSQIGQMIELCCEYLLVWCIWLYVIIMSYAWKFLEQGVRARSSLTFRQTIERRFTLKLVRDVRITYSQMHHTDKYSQHNSIIWPVSLNG